MSALDSQRPPPAPRRRDAAQTRARLLSAATALFSERGYDQVGLRDIAAGAQVTVGLVNRYFGSKHELFAEVVASVLSSVFLLPEDKSRAGEHLARYAIYGPALPSAGHADVEQRASVMLLLRSAGAASATAVLAEQLNATFIRTLAAWLGGPDAETRAGMMCSYMFGVTILDKIMGLDSLGQADPEQLVAYLAPALQALIEPAAAAR